METHGHTAVTRLWTDPVPHSGQHSSLLGHVIMFRSLFAIYFTFETNMHTQIGVSLRHSNSNNTTGVILGQVVIFSARVGCSDG